MIATLFTLLITAIVAYLAAACVAQQRTIRRQAERIQVLSNGIDLRDAYANHLEELNRTQETDRTDQAAQIHSQADYIRRLEQGYHLLEQDRDRIWANQNALMFHGYRLPIRPAYRVLLWPAPTGFTTQWHN